MFDLSEVLSVTSIGPEIIREEHDLGNIDWRAAMTDTAEMLKMGKDVVKAAIGRASLDTSNGRVSVVVVAPTDRDLPWHKLGVMVRTALNSREAQELSNTLWTVRKVELMDPETGMPTGMFLLKRSDTGAQLNSGSVSAKYQPIQNSEKFAFLDSVLSQFGAKYETAGALYGGKKVWMQARLPQTATVQPNDQVDLLATFFGSHDGISADLCFSTKQRIVCANTGRLAMADKGKGISIRHTGNVREKIADAQQALGLAVTKFEAFSEQASAMTRVAVDLVPFADICLDSVLEITRADALKGSDALAAAIATTKSDQLAVAKRFQRQINRRSSLLEEVISRSQSGRCEPQGSAWSAYNAVSETAQHGSYARYKGDDKPSKHFEASLTGKVDELEQVAYRTALAAV